MVYIIKEPSNICFYYIACLSVLYHFYDFPYCLMTVPVRSESKTLIVELRFINLFQYLCNRIFHQFILITGNSQWPHFAFCFFRNIDTPCWIWTIASAFHPSHKICEIFLQILFVIFFSHLINSIRFLPHIIKCFLLKIQGFSTFHISVNKPQL